MLPRGTWLLVALYLAVILGGITAALIWAG